MRVTAQRKQGLAERMATILGIPCERVQVTVIPGQAVQIDIGDLGPDGVFRVTADVPDNKRVVVEAVAKGILQEAE